MGSYLEDTIPGVINLKPGPPLDVVVQMEAFGLRSNKATRRHLAKYDGGLATIEVSCRD